MLTSMPQIDCRPEGTLCELPVDSSIETRARRREASCRVVARWGPNELEFSLWS